MRSSKVLPPTAEAAQEAGLRYSCDTGPGIHRVRAGHGFRYINAKGKTIRDERTLRRIRSLVIPPAWTDVWICTDPDGHLQATGRDARGRKQYRYHPRWREHRDGNKYERLLAFARVLPRIRAQVSRDLRRRGLPCQKVVAALVRLLEDTLIRVGNDEYARHNGSYGLTTLKDRHAHIKSDSLRFEFRGKSGVEHSVTIRDRRLARIVRRCRDIPGEELFQYVDDDGKRRAVGSADVNAYLREASGSDYTSKDFRTWAGTVLAAHALKVLGPAQTKTEAKRKIVEAVKQVSKRLGNTVAVCRKCYIHPVIFEAYLEGATVATNFKARRGLAADEKAVARLLRRPPLAPKPKRPGARGKRSA